MGNHTSTIACQHCPATLEENMPGCCYGSGDYELTKMNTSIHFFVLCRLTTMANCKAIYFNNSNFAHCYLVICFPCREKQPE